MSIATWIACIASINKQVQQISFEHTCAVLGGAIHVVFYDVTTLYFEIDRGDDLRKVRGNPFDRQEGNQRLTKRMKMVS